MYLISLIIPVYNAEDCLENTINSIINQSIGFENIELILVDDNSKDKSRKIIEKYTKMYKNIVPYYSKQNHGYPGFGRNIGLKKSNANYIMFMDNDDELDKDICKKLYESITYENGDIACCNKITVDHISKIRKEINYSNGIKKGNYIIIENDDIPLFHNVSVWNKIFKKQLITQYNINFFENTSADDFIFTITYFLKSKKLIYLKNYFGYYWNIKSDSLSHVVTKEHMEDLLNANDIIWNILKNENKTRLANEIFKENISYLITQSSYLKINKKEFKHVLRRIHNFEKEIEFNIKIAPPIINMINYFILHENYSMCIFLLKTMNTMRKSKLLRKINRNSWE